MIQAESNQPRVEVMELIIPVSSRLKGVLKHLATISSTTLNRFVIKLITDEIMALCTQPEMLPSLIKDHARYMHDLQQELDGWGGKEHQDKEFDMRDGSRTHPEADDDLKIFLPCTFLEAIEELSKAMKRDTGNLLRECLIAQLNEINNAFNDDGLLPFINIDDNVFARLTREVRLIKERTQGGNDDSREG